jgi:hypothetical protein
MTAPETQNSKFKIQKFPFLPFTFYFDNTLSPISTPLTFMTYLT